MTEHIRRTVRVMTWNIHGAAGRNPSFDLARVIELILRADPDIVALQEVDSRGGEDSFSLLQAKLGNHGVGAKSITTADGEYGQMLISRWPIGDIEVSDISYGEREPRRAIQAVVATPLGPLRVVATHLGLSIGERRGQARALLRMTGGKGSVVLLGDFNDWFWPGSVRSILRAAFPGVHDIALFLPGARCLNLIEFTAGRKLLCCEAGPTAAHGISRITSRSLAIFDYKPTCRSALEWDSVSASKSAAFKRRV